MSAEMSPVSANCGNRQRLGNYGEIVNCAATLAFVGWLIAGMRWNWIFALVGGGR